MNSDRIAGAATIIRFSKEYLPIKLLSYLGQLESSQAELWSAILGFGMLKILKIENEITWISDSKTTLSYFSKSLDSKNSPKHVEEWDLLKELTSELIVCCKYSSRHKDLLACDRASRWATNVGEQISKQNSLAGKNLIKDPRYAWQAVDLLSVFNTKNNKLEELYTQLSYVQLYANTSLNTPISLRG